MSDKVSVRSLWPRPELLAAEPPAGAATGGVPAALSNDFESSFQVLVCAACCFDTENELISPYKEVLVQKLLAYLVSEGTKAPTLRASCLVPFSPPQGVRGSG